MFPQQFQRNIDIFQGAKPGITAADPPQSENRTGVRTKNNAF
jgi:hypothetical protein